MSASREVVRVEKDASRESESREGVRVKKRVEKVCE